MKNILIICTTILLCIGCSSTNSVSRTYTDNKASAADKTGASNEVETPQANLSLADYLRKVPGITIQGKGDNIRIWVRMGGSPFTNQPPLFIINGNQMSGYQAASQVVDTNDIRSVQVLKDVSETSAYGMRGQNGVIIVKLKKRG